MFTTDLTVRENCKVKCVWGLISALASFMDIFCSTKSYSLAKSASSLFRSTKCRGIRWLYTFAPEGGVLKKYENLQNMRTTLDADIRNALEYQYEKDRFEVQE